MHEMEESVRYAASSGGVIKKKSSSGCLIIKKKGDGNGIGIGIGGIGGSASASKVFHSMNENKRPRLIPTDSESSGELLDHMRRQNIARSDELQNVPVPVRYRRDSIESERKRSGIPFYHSDRMNDKKMRKEYQYVDTRLKLDGSSGSRIENGSLMADKKKHSYYNGTSRHAYDYREAPDKPIRLQGKNGVLKVMVNKRKQLDLYNRIDDHQKAEKRKGSRSEEALKRNAGIQPALFLDSKSPEKHASFVKTEKIELSSKEKQKLNKGSKAGESETDDSGASLKLGPPVIACGSKNTVIKENGAPASEITAPSTGKEVNVKVKRGTGTEKQILREKIRSMLLNAGWTIDYRPRRNRDYLDAVYVSPSGTAYWSIVKAYEALQKEKNDTLLPEETLSKLTRQTRKKIERELNKKKREESALRYVKEEDGEGKSENTDSRPVQGRTSSKISRCTLLVRSLDKESNLETGGFVPYSGKRTVLSWMIDCGVIKMGEKVQYMNRKKTRLMLEGWVTRDGIHCGCCSKILTVSKFEIHAGSKQRQPFQHVFVESGSSLVQCMVDAWNRQDDAERRGYHVVDISGGDPHDDTCGLCADGGDLICCDGCPSTFHQSCLGVQILPQGDWYCPNCRCKFCGTGSGNIAQENRTTVSELLTCRHCDKKYHKSCCKEMDDVSIDSKNAATFCGAACRELFGHIQKIIGVKHELEAGFSWSLIRRIDPSSSEQLAVGSTQSVECNSKLAVALSVMDECFLPICDRRSGINILHNVLYNCGSNLSRLNFNGFCTVILERGDEIISAASIRIHGTRLAEMPFIGTRHIYRRQGMCHRLLSAIESVLRSLKIEKLMIPAIDENMQTWNEVFKFKFLEELHKQELRTTNILAFPGIDMLQKQLVKQEAEKKNIATNSEKAELDPSSEHVGVHDDAKVDNSSKMNDIVAETNSGLKGNISARSHSENKTDNKNFISISTVNETNEGTVHINANTNHRADIDISSVEPDLDEKLTDSSCESD